MGPSVSRRTASAHGTGRAASCGCRGHGVDSPAGTPRNGLTSPKTGGRLTQAPAGTNPQLVKPSLFFKPRVRRSRSRGQFDKSPCGQSEISSTSCPSACWRLWYKRCYHSTVSLGMLSAVRCPWVSYFSLSLRLGGVFSRFVLLAVRVPARKMEVEQLPCGGGVSGPLGARSL